MKDAVVRNLFLIFSFFLTINSIFATQVFYLEKTESGIDWSIYNTEKKSIKKFNKSNLYPKDIIWSLLGNKVFYHDSKGIYEYNGVSKKTNTLYTYKKEEKTVRLSLNKNGNVRFVLIHKVPESAVIKKEKNEEEIVHFTFENKKHLFNDYYEGTPYMAEVLEIQNKKKRRVSITAITMGSGAATGLSSIESQIENDKNSISLRHLKYSATLAGKNKLNPFSLKKNIFYKLSLAKQKNINKAFSLKGPTQSNDGPNYYSIGNDKGLAAWSVFGDSSHFTAPVFLCHKNCDRPTQILKKPKGQISLSLYKDLLLVADEYTNDDASLIDIQTNKLVHKFNSNSNSVVFLPKELAL